MEENIKITYNLNSIINKDYRRARFVKGIFEDANSLNKECIVDMIYQKNGGNLSKARREFANLVAIGFIGNLNGSYVIKEKADIYCS